MGDADGSTRWQAMVPHPCTVASCSCGMGHIRSSLFRTWGAAGMACFVTLLKAAAFRPTNLLQPVAPDGHVTCRLHAAIVSANWVATCLASACKLCCRLLSACCAAASGAPANVLRPQCTTVQCSHWQQCPFLGRSQQVQQGVRVCATAATGLGGFLRDD